MEGWRWEQVAVSVSLGSLDIFSRDRLDTVSETGVRPLNNLSVSPGNLRVVQSQESPSMMGFCGDLMSKIGSFHFARPQFVMKCPRWCNECGRFLGGIPSNVATANTESHRIRGIL